MTIFTGKGDENHSMSRNPEEVIMSRNGSVLGKKTVLKSDHFPGCQNKRILPHIDGAPNFREVAGVPVYGVAIPTVEGIRNVLQMVGASREGSGRKVLWHNMREEPVVYINGRPFVLREVERPFSNLEYTGIDRERVEAMEARLKEDILHEAARYSNKIMVSDELDSGQMIDLWEPVAPHLVQTPLEVYKTFEAEGYAVEYHRVPVTDEKSPKERDFDLLVSNLATQDRSTAQIFNCQMGRGRTTTGMVVATLLAMRRWPIDTEGNGVLPTTAQQDAGAEEVDETEAALRRGDYTVIRSVVRVLEGGVESKRLVDSVIDRCSAMQNLREAILGFRNAIHVQADERKRQVALSNFMEYLERYYFLICFASFLHDRSQCLESWVGEKLSSSSGGSLPKDRFQEWMKARPELYSILRRLVRRDPMSALAYSRAQHAFLTGQEGKEDLPAIAASGKTEEEIDHMLNVVRSRQGAVLGKETILKADHCPGCQSTTLPERIDGAPNFRAIPGFKVYGVGNPTVQGIRRVLERVGAEKGAGGRRVVWQNMREEATVYINGKPYVLREALRPFKNMKEYTGINKTRVEAMEARLKEDVLAEASRNEGAVVVTQETATGAIFNVPKRMRSQDEGGALADCSARTPAEVFSMLQDEGYNVEYERIPITDGRAPKNRDLDAIARRVGSYDPDTAFVFNCQMGRGRTTTGTVLATLVLIRCLYGRPLSIPPSLTPRSSTDTLPLPQNPGSPNSPMHIDLSSPPSKPDEESDAHDEKRQKLSPANSGVPRSSQSDLFGLEDFVAVRRITRLLDLGEPSRKVLDWVIDNSAMMQNIREAILRYREIFNQQGESAEVRQGALNRGVEYLERYITLIAFTAYLNTPNFVPSGQWPQAHAINGRDAVSPVCSPGHGNKRGREAPGADVAPEGGDVAAVGMPFKDWMRQRPDIRQMRLSMRLRPSRVFGLPDDDMPRPRSSDPGISSDEEAVVMEAVVRSRCGSVLTRSSILKLYHFPGLKVLRTVHGAAVDVPNFFQVPGLPVCSMATPTAEGAKLALRTLLGGEDEESNLSKCLSANSMVYQDGPAVRGEPSSETFSRVHSSNSMSIPRANSGKGKASVRGVPSSFSEGSRSRELEVEGALSAELGTACEVKVLDLREEAVVYIRGQPYVLRDMELPGGPLKHVGIEGPMVAMMEERLKEELLEEAARMGGKILLHREEEEEEEGREGEEPADKCIDREGRGKQPSTELVGFWSSISPSDVMTPAEVYRKLQSEEEGLNVKYTRIPLTRERVPQTADIDEIQKCMDGSNRCVKYLFVSHTGYGAIAYAMAVAATRLLAHLAAPNVEPSYLEKCSRCEVDGFEAPLKDEAEASARDSVFTTPPKFALPESLSIDPSVASAVSVQRSMKGVRTPPSVSPTKLTFATSFSPRKGGSSSGGSGAMSAAEVGLLRGDYRSVLSLERLLVHGPACKTEVDAVVDRLIPVGNILGDILEYKRMMGSIQGDGPEQVEHRTLLKEMGLRALQRYCYLIVYRAYLYSQVAKKGHTAMEADSFTSWVHDRPEITHLCRHLSLE